MHCSVMDCVYALHVFQLSRIYLDMLNVYKVISENVSVAIKTNGENVTKQPLIKSMRTVKKETLKLISSWVGHSNDPQLVSTSFFATLGSCLVVWCECDLMKNWFRQSIHRFHGKPLQIWLF